MSTATATVSTVAENLVQHPHAARPAAPSSARTGQEAGVRTEQRHGPFVPILLLALAFLGWLLFQSTQLWNERTNLRNAWASQAQVVDNAAKMRAQLDGIASGAARLAQQGNPNAKLLVEELARRGVTINAPASAPAPQQQR